MTELENAIMINHECDLNEARATIKDMKHRIHFYGENPEEVLYEEGLEPDYIYDLI